MATDEDINKTLERLELERAMAETVLRGAEAVEKKNSALERAHKSGAMKLEQYEQEKQILQNIIDLQLDSGREALETFSKENKLRINKIKLLEREADLMAEYASDFKSYTGMMSNTMKMSAKLSSTMTGGWINAGFAILKARDNFKKLEKQIGSAAAKMVMIQRAASRFSQFGDTLAGGMIKRFENVVTKADEMRSEFYKNTQASEEMGAVMVGASEKLQHMGLNFELAGKAAQDLRKNSTAFKHANKDMQESMVVTVGVLQQAGVSGETSVKAFDVLTKVLGRDVPSATKSLAKFGSIAESLDMSMEDFSKSFVAASKKLAYNGPKMEKVFIGLQSQAYATGVSMDSLLGIVGQFDTFEGSAKAVAGLNGILGGPYLNSIEMVYMSEEKRIEAMRNSITMSGKQWSSMSKFEKMAVMTAAGVKDLEEANRLFGTSTEEYEKAEAKAKAAAEQQKKFEETALKATKITEKFQHAMNGLVIAFGPALEMVVDLVESFSNWVKGLSELEKKQTFFGIIFAGVALKIIGWYIAMTIKARIFGAAAGTAGKSAAFGAKLASGALKLLTKAWNLLKYAAVFAGNAAIGALIKLKLFASSAMAFLAGISAPVWGLIAVVVLAGAAIWYFWDEIKASFTAGWAWVKEGWDTFIGYLSFDNVIDAVADTFQDIADMLPSSPVKFGPLVGLEKSGEAIPDLLSKGVAKGVKVKVIPRMEKVAQDQLSFHERRTAVMSGPDFGAGAKHDTAKRETTALTPTRTQTQSQQPVQLVIDYKGVKRLLGEISTELLEDAIGLRLA